MLDKNVFNRCLASILITNDIEINIGKNKAFYEMMKNDFTDDEFQKASERICKEENLYNKYPTPPMFYKHKTTKEDRQNLDCQAFLEKVEDYLSMGFVPSDWKQEFIDGLSDTEYRALQSYGGISTLWSDCHRETSPRSMSTILRDLKDSYLNLWTAEQKTDYLAIEQQANPEFAEKTKMLLANAFKKI